MANVNTLDSNYMDPGVQQLLETMLPNYGSSGSLDQLLQDYQAGTSGANTAQGGFVMPGGSSYTFQTAKGNVDDALQAFTQQVQAVTGQAPTADQINQFFSNVLTPMASVAQPGGYNPLNPTNIQQAIQNYVPTAFAQPIQQYQQGQQTDALNQNMATGENMINQNMTGFINNLTNPNSPQYQAFSGNLNNLGITPTSGGFESALGGTIANQESNLQGQLMSSLGAPALSSIQGLSGQANSALNQAQPIAQAGLTSQTNNLNNFQLESQLAQQLAAQGQPSTMQSIMGMANGGAQGAGSLLQGGAQAYKATWICTQMKRDQILGSHEVERLHQHLFKAMRYRPLKFIGYALFGKLAVWLANRVAIDWRDWRPYFYDNCINESDPVKAVDLYAKYFWSLVSEIKRRMRVSCVIVYHKPSGGSV